MALGGGVDLNQSLAVFRGQNGKLIGEAFDTILTVSASNSNILSELQGGEGSKMPFVIKQDLTKGAKDRINFSVVAGLGAQARMGTDQAVGYEELPKQNSWNVRVDNKRVVVGWSEIVAQVATTGKDWPEVYAEMTGTRMGQIEQEDMLMTLITSAVGRNKVRPNNKGSVDLLRSADVMDTDTIFRAAGLGKSFGMEPVKIGKSKGNRPINKYVFFGADAFMRSIKGDTLYQQSVQQGDTRGDENTIFAGGYQDYDGHVIKDWNIVDHDNAGPIGSSILPKALLGDAITSATTTFTMYGGGVTQASLGDQAALYAPFQFFPGYKYKFYQEQVVADDANTYYFVVYDPADGFWCVYSYTGSTGNTGQSILIVNRLAASATGAAVTSLAGWTWDGTQNKITFPTGSFVFPVNASLVPYGRGFMWGADVGAKAYGKDRMRRITNVTDYGNAQGVGITSIYGTGVRLDTNLFPRGFVMIEAAVQHEGVNLPVIT